MHVDVIRYEVRDSGHFSSPTGTGQGAVVLDLTRFDGVDAALDALDTGDAGAVLHLVVPAGRLPVAPRRGGVRFHDSLAAALSAARARHSPVSTT
jgi:hypothetical protein